MKKTVLQVLILSLMALLITACGMPQELPQSPVAVTEPAEDSVARYEPLETCFEAISEGLDYNCGYVIVPEFHGVDNGRTIKLRLSTSR